jgi:hypothetical protein
MTVPKSQAILIVFFGFVVCIRPVFSLFGEPGTLGSVQWVFLVLGAVMMGLGVYLYTRGK